MSLPRSIDRSDLAGSTVTLTTTAETVVLVGPMLQTPKDTSIVVILAALTATIGTAGTGLQLRIRQGATAAGAQIGATFIQGTVTAGAGANVGLMVSFPSNFTDYSQVCLTAQQVAATGNGTVQGATLLAVSF